MKYEKCYKSQYGTTQKREISFSFGEEGSSGWTRPERKNRGLQLIDFKDIQGGNRKHKTYVKICVAKYIA